MLAMAALVLVIHRPHRASDRKRLAALAFGLFLATVGIETAFSTQRYTFPGLFEPLGMLQPDPVRHPAGAAWSSASSPCPKR